MALTYQFAQLEPFQRGEMPKAAPQGALPRPVPRMLFAPTQDTRAVKSQRKVQTSQARPKAPPVLTRAPCAGAPSIAPHVCCLVGSQKGRNTWQSEVPVLDSFLHQQRILGDSQELQDLPLHLSALKHQHQDSTLRPQPCSGCPARN